MVYDLVVVGGGINGTGIARDAAGRGFSVLLCEQDDLAQHTSSASTKLIHGGLRYLEHGELRLVHKALVEREVLLRTAPHLVRPLQFILPLDVNRNGGGRPAWMIRTGLLLYDLLARHDLLPGSESIRLAGYPAGEPLKSEFVAGFAYWDARVDDARLVVANALDASERGAAILVRTCCVAAERRSKDWTLILQDRTNGRNRRIEARAMVNAAGPWVAQLLQRTLGVRSGQQIRLIKGSHIIVPKLFGHDCAYIFQNPDRRVTFAIPFEGAFTLIGTTDVEYSSYLDPAAVRIEAAEIAYLCGMASRYFRRPVVPEDVVHAYSGVRPLLEDESKRASALTRDYRFDLNRDGAPLLSVFGGKITTYRKLAEEAVDVLSSLTGANRSSPGRWTDDVALPGGDFPDGDFDLFLGGLRERFPWLSESLSARLARVYGTRTSTVLGEATSEDDLGPEIAPGLHERELEHLVSVEWARTAEDILWRRTKLGLHLPASEQEAVAKWMKTRLASLQASIFEPDPNGYLEDIP